MQTELASDRSMRKQSPLRKNIFIYRSIVYFYSVVVFIANSHHRAERKTSTNRSQDAGNMFWLLHLIHPIPIVRKKHVEFDNDEAKFLQSISFSICCLPSLIITARVVRRESSVGNGKFFWTIFF